MPAPYTGGCQCGALRYVLEAEPQWLVACPCTECQRQSARGRGLRFRLLVGPPWAVSLIRPTDFA